MTIARRVARAIAVSSILTVSACALLSKSDSVILRYFTPERVLARTNATNPAGATRNLQLRLGRVGSASYLREKIAYRDSDYEVGFYEFWRWTERPEEYVRRAAQRALFEDQGMKQVISGVAPTLEVTLTAFEELKAPRHAARVELTWQLRDDKAVSSQKTLVVERPIAGPSDDPQIAAVANTMADALGEAVNEMVQGVVTELTRSEPP